MPSSQSYYSKALRLLDDAFEAVMEGNREDADKALWAFKDVQAGMVEDHYPKAFWAALNKRADRVARIIKGMGDAQEA